MADQGAASRFYMNSYIKGNVPLINCERGGGRVVDILQRGKRKILREEAQLRLYELRKKLVGWVADAMERNQAGTASFSFIVS